jgi:glycosyltransferase involved in cell wall biosynthesis
MLANFSCIACEKCVIVTPVGEITDIVVYKKNGMLIHINDANALNERVCELLNNGI